MKRSTRKALVAAVGAGAASALFVHYIVDVREYEARRYESTLHRYGAYIPVASGITAYAAMLEKKPDVATGVLAGSIVGTLTGLVLRVVYWN